MKKIKLFLLFLVLLACFWPTNSTKVAAAKANGITISPAFQQITINPDESDHTLQITLTNNYNVPETLRLSTADFNALDESGGLFFEGVNTAEVQHKYGLANWISLPSEQVTIPAKQSQVVKASIINLPSLAPGGHYGAIMFSLDTGQYSPSNNRVGVQPIASSLLFVNKMGGGIYNLKLSSLKTGHNPFRLPGLVTLNFANQGNVHLIPRGVITITDNRQQIVSRGVINDNSGIILPEKTRLYSIQLLPVANAGSQIHGKYTLTTSYRFDGFDQYRSYVKNLSVVTPISLLMAFILAVVLVAIFLGLRQYSLAPKKR